jgi:hypothetical protein
LFTIPQNSEHGSPLYSSRNLPCSSCSKRSWQRSHYCKAIGTILASHYLWLCEIEICLKPTSVDGEAGIAAWTTTLPASAVCPKVSVFKHTRSHECRVIPLSPLPVSSQDPLMERWSNTTGKEAVRLRSPLRFNLF